MSERSALPTFRRIERSIGDGCVVKPALWAYLYEARFPKTFSVEFSADETYRQPDGKFHPSQHPFWPVRKLWLWHHYPEEVIPEPLGIDGILSVTMGKALHSFADMCLYDLGLMLDDNVPVSDEATASVGEMDGLLRVHIPGFPGDIGWEFKSMNDRKVRTLVDLDVAIFKQKCPGYWGQAQDYMRMNGHQLHVVGVLSLGYPWEIREIHIERDEGFIADLNERYGRAVSEESMPAPCCAPMSEDAKVCEMRAVCPVGQETLVAMSTPRRRR